MTNIIEFPPIHIDEFERAYFDLCEGGCTPSIVISNQNIMSLAFELRTSPAPTADAMQSMARTQELFTADRNFRERFFEVVFSYGAVLQEFGCAKPIVDFNRTIDDVRRELGIEV